jgi:phage terminase large subunit GpA-like protein
VTATLAQLNQRKSRDLRPTRPPRRLSQFAPTLRLPDGPSAGNNWIPTSEPTQQAFLEAIESRRWGKFVVVAPSQRGKTLKAILCPVLYAIAECRQSVAYVMPNLDKLAQNWSGKIEPAIVGTGYKAWLPVKGPGSKGGKPAVLTMRNPESGLVAGRLYFMAMGTGGRETSLSSVSTQTVACDEGDDAESAGQLSLVFKRSESFGGDGRGYVVSTVNARTRPDGTDRTKAEDHPILALHTQGTQHRMFHLCPHCRELVLPDFEHINLDAGCIFCPNCAALWSEPDRHSALNGGVFRATVEEPQTPGLYSELTTGLDYHMAVIASICSDIRAAKKAEIIGDPSLMRTVMHKIFCRPYEEPAAATDITNKGLAAVSDRSDYEKRLVPHWVTHMGIGVDIQDDRAYWLAKGFGPDDRSCYVDWGYEMYVPAGQERAPTPADLRRTLTEIDSKANVGWQKEGSTERMIPFPGLRGVDVGFRTDEIVGWLRGMKGWRPCRGVGKDTLRQLGEIMELPPEARAFVELRRPDGWPMVLVNVQADNVRRWIHAALLRDPYTPASAMLPRGLKSNDMLCLHLSGEVETEDKDGHLYWREVRTRHDLLDCDCYVTALSRLRIGVQTVNAGRAKRKYGRIGDVGGK